MPANFLHGVETIEIDTGPRPVRLVKSSVVGLIGTAGSGPINQNVLVTKYGDIAQFGTQGTIARELKRLFDQKPTVVIVRNVYDPAAPAADINTVTAAQIIGGVDVVTGARTGMFGWRDSYQQFGFNPKILIAPGFSSLSAVSAAMIVQATAMRAVAFVDAPIGVTVPQAIAGRGVGGAINFNTSSDRVGLCYPHVKYYDTVAAAEVNGALSTLVAGAWSRRDQENGYWWSGSNIELLGITGVERPIEFSLNDPNCEANLLNEAGIITVANSFGTGIRAWGNRSAAWPTVSHQKNFLNVRRTADIISESLELATLQFIDQPLDNARIDDILESGRRFLRHQVANGAIQDGDVWLDKDLNTPETLSAGHLLPSYDFAPYSPLERVSYQARINTEYLRQLVATRQA
ncbi:phage tail sheath subtilisin-like domain-containing protein [Hydrogenophaga sp. A37]|uniref:phage tail sheath subtilisin-like domain-containing protein n=1 Tax=Hydrogenophaga sp. A37 TaxID=1945864 RepID=UPI000985D14E|nr:phage tail sheath subtilisin-like domain-containing protein [Hydrogenophaga sp. A37]OOG79173.1 phage tail protein [Hydrogenophaga sp. A37]